MDSEIPLMHPQDTRSGIFAKPALEASSSEFSKLSGRSMRTSRGNLPFDMWDNTALLVPALPAESPAPAPTPFSLAKMIKFRNSPLGIYQANTVEHASLNPWGERWTRPARPLPYRDPAHKGPASGACQPYNHFKPLNDFDQRNQVRNHSLNSNCQHRSVSKTVKRKQRKDLIDTRIGLERAREDRYLMHHQLLHSSRFQP